MYSLVAFVRIAATTRFDDERLLLRESLLVRIGDSSRRVLERDRPDRTLVVLPRRRTTSVSVLFASRKYGVSRAISIASVRRSIRLRVETLIEGKTSRQSVTEPGNDACVCRGSNDHRCMCDRVEKLMNAAEYSYKLMFRRCVVYTYTLPIVLDSLSRAHTTRLPGLPACSASQREYTASGRCQRTAVQTD